MAIQVRRGKEDELDISKAVPGEWLVSTDTRYVRMCFAPGIVLRMATYEAFEADMAQIQAILEEAKTVEEAIQKIYDDVQQVVIDIETASNAAQIAIEKSEESKEFATAAASSASAAKTSETNAKNSASSASTSASTATKKATEASTYANNAKKSENTANTHATTASNKASEASTSANTASVKANDASDSALLAESYTHGGTGVRDNEDVDNAQYYKNQAERISQGLSGALLPMGTITFSQLANQTKQAGYMYNISNSFTTDNTFKEGAGYSYPEGTNVYYTADGYWDCLAGTAVTGVKGAKENTYRQGNVDITPENVGAVAIGGDTASNTVTFTSEDAIGSEEEPLAWSAVDLLASGEKHSSFLNKISTMFKNIRYLYKLLGATDISNIGNGTVTGAISQGLIYRGNISSVSDYATAPIGIYYTDSVDDNTYNLIAGCYLFKTRRGSLANAYMVSNSGNTSIDGMYVFRQATGKFERVVLGSDLASNLPFVNGSQTNKLKVCYGSISAQFDENGKTIITLSDTFTYAVPIINIVNGHSITNSGASGNTLSITNTDLKNATVWLKYIVVGV